jgi:hypothetical protein
MNTAEDKLSYDERLSRGMEMGPEYDFTQLERLGLSKRADDWSEVVAMLR